MATLCPKRIASGLQRHEAPNCFAAMQDASKVDFVTWLDQLYSLDVIECYDDEIERATIMHNTLQLEY